MPLYQCTECGEHTRAPVEATDSDVVPLDCPSCGHDDLVDVDDRCRFGRTLMLYGDEDPCFNEATTVWDAERAIRNWRDDDRRLCEGCCEKVTEVPA